MDSTFDGFLDQLQDIAIFHANSNNFGGTLSPKIANLPYLYELDIRCLEKVEILNFAGNKLYGIVPDVICALGNLANLSLSDNYFTGFGPSCLRLIENGVLDLKNNCIPGLPFQKSIVECVAFFVYPRILGFGRLGKFGFGIAAISGFFTGGSLGFVIAGTSSFGTRGISDFGVLGISDFGTSGFDTTDSSGFRTIFISIFENAGGSSMFDITGISSFDEVDTQALTQQAGVVAHKCRKLDFGTVEFEEEAYPEDGVWLHQLSRHA
ncbi:hypothetical protein K7X08_001939 [Anisodus acutangulus]|uniref:Uncharacterized protein n=1 Tax=Anisodus acutangulus TaxID=402998 RepID=A0A9Q1LNA5_9SOLA|nr:hypothetical protein K7X08_001939 [Anisodus acutangulus]